MSPFTGFASGRSQPLAFFAAVLTAAAAGTLVVINPIIIAVALLSTFLAAALTSAASRFVIVISGGVLVMGSSSQLDTPKMAYLVFVAATAAVGLVAYAKQTEPAHSPEMRWLLVASALTSGAIVGSLLVGLTAGTELIDAIRDSAPYALLAVAPLVAWDGAPSRAGQHVGAIIVVAGLVASFGFAAEFAGRRGIIDLPLATLGLPSIMLATLAFVVACAAILSRRPRRTLWAIVAALVLVLLLGTGTRSVLALLAGPLAMVLAHGQRLTRLGRLVGAVVIVGLAMVTLGYLAAQSGLVDVARLVDRLNSLIKLGSNLSADPSYIERATQVGLAWSTFTGSPVVGVGLGFTFDVPRFGGQTVAAFTLDTSVAVAAKFGVVGLALLGLSVLAVVSFYRRVRDRLPEHTRLAFVGFAVVSVAFLPLGNPTEDKGFALATALLLAWALASARMPQPNPDAVRERTSAPPENPWVHIPIREGKA